MVWCALTAFGSPSSIRTIPKGEDRNGNLWFASEKDLWKYKDGDSVIYETKDGLPGRDVKTIYEDRRGDMWFGTYGGLARLANGQFTSYTERDGLASNRVRYIYEDAEGIFWIGTYDGGLSRFKNGRFTNYNVESGNGSPPNCTTAWARACSSSRIALFSPSDRLTTGKRRRSNWKRSRRRRRTLSKRCVRSPIICVLTKSAVLD